MKKTTFFLILILFVHYAFSQKPIYPIANDTINFSNPIPEKGIIIEQETGTIYINKSSAPISTNTNLNEAKTAGNIMKTGVIDSYTTLDGIRAEKHPKNTIILEGYNGLRDGGGGSFYWSAASVAADDSIFTIKLTGIETGRYIRIWDKKKINILWAGAVADDGNYDNWPSFRTVLNYIKNNMALFGNNAPVISIPQGIFYFENTIDLDVLGENVLKIKIEGNNKFGNSYLRTRNVAGFNNFINIGSRAVEFESIRIASGTTGINAPDTLVNAKNATNSIFINCAFGNPGNVGLQIGKYYNVVEKCIFDGHTNQEAIGLLIKNDSTAAPNSEQVNFLVVAGNQFKQLEHGIWINARNSYSITIKNNSFEDQNSISIYCEKYVNGLYIYENYFEANGFQQGDLANINNPQPVQMSYWKRIASDHYDVSVKPAFGCIVLGNKQIDSVSQTNLHYTNVIIERNIFSNNAKRAILSYTGLGSLKFVDNHIVSAANTPDTIFKAIGAGSPKGIAKDVYLEFIDQTKLNDTDHFTGKLFYMDDINPESNTNVKIKYIDYNSNTNLLKIIEGIEISARSDW